MRTTLTSLTAVVAAAVTVVAAGCGDSGGPGEGTATPERPTVVVTTSVWGDVVANVAGEQAEVSVLLPAGADPHTFQPSAKDTRRLLDADLVVANGLGLEESLQQVLEQARDEGVPVVEVAPEVDPLPLEGGHTHDDDHGHDHDHGEDGDHGHDHGSQDPHVWLDPARVAKAVRVLGSALADLPGVDAGAVEASTEAYEQEVLAAHERILGLVGDVPDERRRLVSSHDSLRYFAHRYGFEVLGVVHEGGSSESAPDATHLVELAALIDEEDVGAVFTDEGGDDDVLVSTIAEPSGAVVVPLHTEGLGPAGSDADTYLGLIETNARRITQALSD